MTLDEAIKRYKNHSECIQQTLITKEEAVNVYEWLRELKKYRIAHWKLRDMDYEYDFNSMFGDNPMYYSENVWDLFGNIDASVEYEVMRYEEVNTDDSN